MKFLSRLGIVLLVLAAAYGGLLWKTGQEVESKLMAISKRTQEIYPYFSVMDRTFEKGVFSSKEVLSWAFVLPDQYGFGEKATKIPVFKTETIVKHCPFQDFQLALTTSQTRFLAYDNTFQQVMDQFFKGKSPLLITTKVPMFGSVEVNASSPELKLEIAKGEGVHWQGLNIDVLLDKKFAGYSYDAKLPGFMVESRSEHFSFSGIQARGNGTKPFEEFPYFFIGKEQGGIDTIRVDAKRSGAAFDLVDFSYNADAGLSNGLLGANLKMKAALLNLLNLGLENLNMDLAFSGIDARALAQFQSEVMSLHKTLDYSDLAGYSASMNAFFGKITALFKESSRFEVRDFSGKNKGGSIRTKGSIELGSLAAFAQVIMAAELQGKEEEEAVQAALNKLSGECFMEASRESLVILAGEIGAEDFGGVREAQNFVNGILDALIENSLVESQNNILKTKLLMKDGQVTMNGIAVDSAKFRRILGTDDHDADVDEYEEGVEEEVGEAGEK